jgi:hypothetical protein
MKKELILWDYVRVIPNREISYGLFKPDDGRHGTCAVRPYFL